MVKTILMRSEIEMRNMLLETEEKASLVIKWERIRLGCVVLQCFVEYRTCKR